MYRVLIVAFILLLRLRGQTFDVASVRPHDPANKNFIVHLPTAGQFSGEGAPLNLLMMIAYDIQESQITGGPNWMASEKWDITAKCDDRQHGLDDTRRMLQHLLEDRFSLKIHREIRQRPVYALAIARGGPKFHASEKSATNVRSGPHSILLDRGSISGLADVLATAVGRPVIDRTGLTDSYDLSLTWDDAPVRDAGLSGRKIRKRGNCRQSVIMARSLLLFRSNSGYGSSHRKLRSKWS